MVPRLAFLAILLLAGCNVNASKEARIQKLEAEIQQAKDEIEAIRSQLNAIKQPESDSTK